MKIGGKNIGGSNPVYIIGEAGVNHNGDFELAKKLVDVAKEAGVDAVKFQSFKTEELIIPSVEKAEYQKETTGQSESQFEMLRKLEMRLNQMKEIKSYCESVGITFLTTPFDEVSLEELDELNVEAYKIASTDTTNLGFLRKVAAKGKPVIISSGMCYMREVEKAMEVIQSENSQVGLLQCTANYPVQSSEVNLSVLDTYLNSFDAIIGYSDHTVGLGASPYAVARGAKIIEKHFTLDKNMEGPDHSASLDPKELKEFVKVIRDVELMIGSAVKAPTESEQGTRKSLQKCLVASKEIKAGEEFNDDNIIGKRTGGNGVSVFEYENVVGKIAARDFSPNELIEL